MPLTAALTIDAIATVDDGRTHLTATFGYAWEILDDVAVRELRRSVGSRLCRPSRSMPPGSAGVASLRQTFRS